MWIHSVTIQRRCIFNEIDLIYRPAANHWPWIQSAHFTLTHWRDHSNQKVRHLFPKKIQDISQLHTLTVSVHLHARIFLLNPSDSFVKFSFFCICHSRSEISANITAICNDIGWVILQVKHSNANVSVLHHRATLTLIENLENYWTVKQGASSLWEISRGQLNRPSLIWNSQIKVEFRSSIWRALENWQQLKWIFWLV